MFGRRDQWLPSITPGRVEPQKKGTDFESIAVIVGRMPTLADFNAENKRGQKINNGTLTIMRDVYVGNDLARTDIVYRDNIIAKPGWIHGPR